jgi:hypothetical protein
MEEEVSADYSFKYRERMMVTGREGAFRFAELPKI